MGKAKTQRSIYEDEAPDDGGRSLEPASSWNEPNDGGVGGDDALVGVPDAAAPADHLDAACHTAPAVTSAYTYCYSCVYILAFSGLLAPLVLLVTGGLTRSLDEYALLNNSGICTYFRDGQSSQPEPPLVSRPASIST